MFVEDNMMLLLYSNIVQIVKSEYSVTRFCPSLLSSFYTCTYEFGIYVKVSLYTRIHDAHNKITLSIEIMCSCSYPFHHIYRTFLHFVGWLDFFRFFPVFFHFSDILVRLRFVVFSSYFLLFLLSQRIRFIPLVSIFRCFEWFSKLLKKMRISKWYCEPITDLEYYTFTSQFNISRRTLNNRMEKQQGTKKDEIVERSKK